MPNKTSKTLGLIKKCLWQSGAEDLYRRSYRVSLKMRGMASLSPGVHLHSTRGGKPRLPVLSNKHKPSNPMLNGVSILQWFFDEVKPDQREVRYWMKHFGQATQQDDTFAVIQICEDVFEQEKLDQAVKEEDKSKRTILETLSLSLYFLQQNKMNVILLVGSSNHFKADKNPRDIRQIISQNIRTLVDRLEESGTKSRPVIDGGQLFSVDKESGIEKLNTQVLNWMTSHGNIPVIGCIGEDADGQLSPIQLDDAVQSIAAHTIPIKVLKLNAAGGIRDQNGQRINTVFLPHQQEIEKFRNLPWWNNETEQTFKKVCDLLGILPKKSSYVITSAREVLSELLTQRGVGTMFKKVVPVMKYTSLDDHVILNGNTKQLKEVLVDLVNSAFERPTSDAYWENLSERLKVVYITVDMKSCAIVLESKEMPSVFYLDKFAVCQEERGNFNTEVLWQQLKHDFTNLFWRSRHNNAFNSWYESRCDGIIKLGFYHVFWYGSEARHKITEIIKACETLPSSFTLPG